MSLRSRIVAVVVALVVIALAVTDTLTYTSLKNYLIQRVDQQLAAISAVSPNGAVLHALVDPNDPNNRSLAVPPGTFGAVFNAQHLLAQLPVSPLPDSNGAAPRVPHSLITQVLNGPPTGAVIATVGGTEDTQFRVIAQRVPLNNPESATGTGSTPGVFVVAIPLSDVDATLSRLLVLELIVSGAVLVALAAAAWVLVRVGLRPLEKMADTAGEIAAGDLTQRVEETDERTEVGRLGSALNVMLSRIETAFRAREESEARLRRFVADASHELRTPLTSIRGYAELFDHGLAERPADLRTAMRRIESESTRMGVLVEDLLLLARLDQGRPLELEPVDLVPLASDAVTDARVLDPSREITLQAPERCEISGDELRLRQVITNLVSNALAHTPAGTPVEVVVSSEAANGVAPGPAVLSVVDHGPGVPQEAATRIFERFWRSDPSRVRARGGTGLGLSIVSAITAAHGGRVELSETPGGGATFKVELPVEPDRTAGTTGVEFSTGDGPDAPDFAADLRPGPPEIAGGPDASFLEDRALD